MLALLRAHRSASSSLGGILAPKNVRRAVREFYADAREGSETTVSNLFPSDLFPSSTAPIRNTASAPPNERAFLSINFEVAGQPVAKQRARHRAVNTRDHRQLVTTYTPKETEHYENRIAMAAREAMSGREPFRTPLEVELLIGVGVPKSWSEKRRTSITSRRRCSMA
jgi:hypothetical protein